MATLTNTKIKDTYDGLLKTTDNEALDVSGVTLIEDGLGNASALSVGRSGNGVTITGSLNATLATAAQPNITSVGTLSSLSVSGNLAVDTNTLYVDAANNRVGVGTSSPDTQIEVESATGGVIRLSSSDTTVETGDSIGRLEFKSNDVSTGGINVMGFVDCVAENPGTIYGLSFGTGFAAAATERMRIDSSGNVGIGESNPENDNRLHIKYSEVNVTPLSNSPLVVERNDVCLIQTLTSNASDAGILFGDGDDNDVGGLFYLHGSDAMTFRTATSERMRINSSGFLKASNDGTYLNASGTYHEIRTVNNGYILYATNTNADPLGAVIEFTSVSPNGTGNVFLYAGDSSAARFVVRSNGGIANYQANDVNLSDERVKKDIATLTSYWDKFKDIEVVTFKYKDQTHDDTNIGFIAQQVESVAPEFVDADGFDPNAELIEGEEPLKAIYSADMYNAAIKVLQEAMIKIETLEAKVATLESQLNA